jgi:hypothetical protein
VLNAGVVPRDGDSDGYVDDVRRKTASSKVWSALAIASCGNVEGRLESAAAADVVEVLEALRFKTNRRR